MFMCSTNYFILKVRLWGISTEGAAEKSINVFLVLLFADCDFKTLGEYVKIMEDTLSK